MTTPTVDLHLDTPWVMHKYGYFELSGDGIRASGVSLSKLRQGRLDIPTFALYLSDQTQDQLGVGGTKQAIDKQVMWLSGQAGCRVAKDSDEAQALIAGELQPMFLGLEGGRLINESRDRLRELRDVGVRYLTITHNKNTSWADSATDKAEHGGLTLLGQRLVEYASLIGVYPDISHSSDKTAEHVLDYSGGPVLATHSGCRSLVDHPRNLTDRLIGLVAETGGLIGVPFATRFVKNVGDHIDHIVKLVGPDHVGIGSDIDGAACLISDVSEWKKVVMDELSARGYTDESIAKIAGGNVLRLFS